MLKNYKPKDPYEEARKDIEYFNSVMLTKPVPGSAGITGTWRTYKPVFNTDKCIKCGLCWLYCPEGVIDWETEHYPQVDYTYCK